MPNGLRNHHELWPYKQKPPNIVIHAVIRFFSVLLLFSHTENCCFKHRPQAPQQQKRSRHSFRTYDLCMSIFPLKAILIFPSTVWNFISLRILKTFSCALRLQRTKIPKYDLKSIKWYHLLIRNFFSFSCIQLFFYSLMIAYILKEVIHTFIN